MRLSRLIALCLVPLFVLLVTCSGTSTTSALPCNRSPVSITAADSKDAQENEHQKEKRKEEKSRVPKSTPGSKEKKKTEEHESEEGDFWGSCLGSLIGDMMCSMFSGGSESEGEGEIEVAHEPAPAPIPPTGEAQAGLPPGETAVPLAVGDVCVVNPGFQDDKAATVWTEPGCAGGEGSFVCSLVRGSRVRVTAVTECEGVRWVNVEVLDDECPGGWLLERHLSLPEPMGEPPVLEPGAPAGPGAPGPQWPAAELVLSISPVAYLEEELSQEYVELGVNFALGVRASLSDMVTIGARVGVQTSKGDPQFDYESATQLDFPRDSRLTIVDIGPELGLRFGVPPGRPCFTLAAGPSVYYVKETASIDFLRIADSQTGTYEAELSKWKVGGQANVGFEWTFAELFSLGANVGYSFIPWTSDESASLTLDWLDKSYIDFMSFGVTIGWSFF